MGLVGCDSDNNDNEVRQYVVRDITCTVDEFMNGAWMYIMPSNAFVSSVTIKSTGGGMGTVEFTTLEGTFIYDVQLSAVGDAQTGELTQVSVTFVGMQTVNESVWASLKNLGILWADQLVKAGACVVLNVVDGVAVADASSSVADSEAIQFYGPWEDNTYPELEGITLAVWAEDRMAGTIEFWLQNPSGEPPAVDYSSSDAQ